MLNKDKLHVLPKCFKCNENTYQRSIVLPNGSVESKYVCIKCGKQSHCSIQKIIDK